MQKAQAAGTRPNISQIPAKLLNNSTFLNTFHGQLAVMTGPTKGLGGDMEVSGMDMEEVKEAYEVVKRMDVLDVSVGMWFFFISYKLFVIYE